MDNSPSYSSFVTADAGKNWWIWSWNRPTIGWSLSCEAEGKSRADGFAAIEAPSANNEMDSDLFNRMGKFIVIFFTIFIVAAILLHLVLLRSFTTQKKAYWFLWAVYIPSRITYVVWGPWLGARCNLNLTNMEDNLNGFKMVNECGDEYTKIDVESVQSGVDSLYPLWRLFVVTNFLILFECLFWIMYWVRKCSDKPSQNKKTLMLVPSDDI